MTKPTKIAAAAADATVSFADYLMFAGQRVSALGHADALCALEWIDKELQRRSAYHWGLPTTSSSASG
jgi:hypothetical protein